MEQLGDTNAAIWQSGEIVQAWAAEEAERERKRAEHRQFLARLLPFGDEAFTFLDLGAGTGAASRAILAAHPRSTAILADFSAEMMSAGEQEMRPFAGRYSCVEFDMSAAQWPAAIPAALDAVVTSMCVHHLTDERKQGLFGEIFGRLVPGGWFFNYDLVRAPDPLVEATWERVSDRDDPEAADRRRNRTPQQQARWDNHVRYMIPLGPQLDYLRSAGFEGIDVYWKQLENVIYGGCRPAGPVLPEEIDPGEDGGVPGTLKQAIDATTVAMLRARGSFKWTAPGPDGFGAAVAEMDFGAAPPILDALARLSADANFGYLPPFLADELAAACAEFERRRYGWDVDPAMVRHVPDVIKVLEIAITQFSRPGSPVILPTPAYMPFLIVPGFHGREIIQVRMRGEAGFFTLDLDGIEDAFRAGGHLLIFCNPHNPLGRVFTAGEMTQLTEIVEKYGGRVFADEIHAPLVYPGMRHIPYATTSQAAASHTLTATSASKAWNLPGLKCGQVILSNEPDRERWEEMGMFASHGASNPGVVANIAAYRHGEAWLDEALAYLDDSRHLLGKLLSRHLPDVRYRPPDGTYLSWLDCTALDLPRPPGEMVVDNAHITVVDGPAFGAGGAGAFRFNFATPQPILTDLVERIAAVLNPDPARR